MELQAVRQGQKGSWKAPAAGVQIWYEKQSERRNQGAFFSLFWQHERELYQQQMRNLEKENEMHAPEMRNHKENTQELEVERAGMQEDLEHGAAALKKLRDSTQVLSAALS